MSAQMIHLHPRLFARSSVEGPDDLAAELAAAGMLAASWQVEQLIEERDEAVKAFDELDYNVPADCRTPEDLEKRDEEIKTEGKAEGRTEIKAEIEPHLEELERLLDTGGRLKRADVEAIAQAMREIVG